MKIAATPHTIYEELTESGLSLDEALRFTSHVLEQTKLASGVGVAAGLAAGIPAGLEKLTGTLRNVHQMTYPLAMLAAAAPPLLGYTAGNALARSLDAGGDDVEDIQQSDVIAELRAAAARLRQAE